MKPTIGRIVHFHSPVWPQAQAAIITCVNDDDTVDLTVFWHKHSPSTVVSVPYETGYQHWTWPPRD